MDTRKQDILQAIQAHVNQRPGLDFANYGDVKYYRQDYRQILQAKHDFEAMLGQIMWRDSLTANDLLEASRSAFSGRLTITEGENRRVEVEYCTGQYWPTEYRNAACAVLARALWRYWAADCETGDEVRKLARDTFGRGIQSRWFN